MYALPELIVTESIYKIEVQVYFVVKAHSQNLAHAIATNFSRRSTDSDCSLYVLKEHAHGNFDSTIHVLALTRTPHTSPTVHTRPYLCTVPIEVQGQTGDRLGRSA